MLYDTTSISQFVSVAQSYPTLCDPMDCSTPGFPVHHQLPELVQTHVHRDGDAIQPSHPLVIPFSSCLQSFPVSGSFPVSQFFISGGQSIGVSGSASVLPVNIQDLFPKWTHLQNRNKTTDVGDGTLDLSLDLSICPYLSEQLITYKAQDVPA